MLIVDDSDFFCQLLVPTLSAAGYHVTAVARVQDALALRENDTLFDAIISDIDMPDMDGLDFVCTLRQGGAWANLPIIALSAHTEPAAITTGRDAGFTDYVAKSDRHGLLASLTQCLSDPLATAAI